MTIHGDFIASEVLASSVEKLEGLDGTEADINGYPAIFTIGAS